jgi:hypothetical protein
LHNLLHTVFSLDFLMSSSFAENTMASSIAVADSLLVANRSGWLSMRAGVLVCERPCKDGFLDYQFGGMYTSSSNGPMLLAKWGEGSFNEGSETQYLNSGTVNRWYRFGAGQGLQLNEATCISQSKWTIIIWARLDQVNGARQLMGSEAWSEDGLFVANSKYRFLPESAGLACDEIIRTTRFYQFGVTRSDDGTVTLYLNGFKCSTGKPDNKDGFTPAKDDITFFRSGGSNAANVAGYVQSIRLWNKALKSDEMLKACNCKLPSESSKACGSTIVMNVPYKGHKYSSVWGGSSVGTGWATGRLNSGAGWISGNANTGAQNGAFLQLDGGKVQSIAGVVTQGAATGWFTRSFTIMVSDDSAVWQQVACGKVFEANTDWNTKAEVLFPAPIRTRYVKLIVEEYSGYPSMRAGLLTCEVDCVDGLLDYRFDDGLTSSSGGPSLTAPWGDGSFDSNNQWYRFGATQGLLLDQKACIDDVAQWSIIVQARLDNNNGKVVISSAAWGTDGLFVDSIARFLPASLKLSCNEKILSSRFYQFGLVRNSAGNISISLNGYTCGSAKPSQRDGFKLSPRDITFFHSDQNNANTAGYLRRIRVYKAALTKEKMASECGCNLPNLATSTCLSSVIQNVPYSKHRYSSTWGNYEKGVVWGQGKLNAVYSWLPGSARTGFTDGEWLQMDTGAIQAIAGVVTQGRGDAGWWTTSYAVKVSDNGDDWTEVACGRWFPANTDMNTKVMNPFPEPVRARYVRLYPTE